MIDDASVEDDDDERRLIMLDWGERPGRVVGVLRQYLGLTVSEVSKLRKQSRPVVATGGMKELFGLVAAVEEAGATVDIRFVDETST